MVKTKRVDPKLIASRNTTRFWIGLWALGLILIFIFGLYTDGRRYINATALLIIFCSILCLTYHMEDRPRNYLVSHNAFIPVMTLAGMGITGIFLQAWLSWHAYRLKKDGVNGKAEIINIYISRSRVRHRSTTSYMLEYRLAVKDQVIIARTEAPQELWSMYTTGDSLHVRYLPSNLWNHEVPEDSLGHIWRIFEGGPLDSGGKPVETGRSR